jgi:hypothetical protein
MFPLALPASLHHLTFFKEHVIATATLFSTSYVPNPSYKCLQLTHKTRVLPFYR